MLRNHRVYLMDASQRMDSASLFEKLLFFCCLLYSCLSDVYVQSFVRMSWYRRGFFCVWGLRGGEEKMVESTLVKMNNPDPTK